MRYLYGDYSTMILARLHGGCRKLGGAARGARDIKMTIHYDAPRRRRPSARERARRGPLPLQERWLLYALSARGDAPHHALASAMRRHCLPATHFETPPEHTGPRERIASRASPGRRGIRYFYGIDARRHARQVRDWHFADAARLKRRATPRRAFDTT